MRFPASLRPSTLALRACVLLAFAITASACGAKQQPADPPIDRESDGIVVIEMDPMVIRAHVDEDGTQRVAASDLRDLFDEATAYYQAGDYVDAIRLYQLVLDATDEEIWSKAAMYNMGLSWESLSAWEEAAQTFDDIIAFFPTSKEARDAHFRLAEALAWLGEFQRVPPLMTSAMQRPDLNTDRRLEALVRSGTANFELRRFTAAERELGRALTLDEEDRSEAMQAVRTIQRGRVATRAVAQANFLLGRIYHEIFSEIRMLLPVERYKRDLADKNRLFDQALDWYTRAVRTGDVYWAPQAGYMMGKLYEDAYFDILASELPDHFTDEHHQIYFAAMREYLADTLDRCLRMYEQALGMSYRMGSQDPVIESLLEDIDRLQSYRDNQDGWEEEHLQIIAGTHAHSPRPAGNLVFRGERVDDDEEWGP